MVDEDVSYASAVTVVVLQEAATGCKGKKETMLAKKVPAAQVLSSIRNRHSTFPRNFSDRLVPRSAVELILKAAKWAPFHGPVPPWRFCVLGRKSIVSLQELTLKYYDENWQQHFSDEAAYLKFRTRTENEITGRWAPCSFMIAIIMQRQAGPKTMPRWEELSATACAVQNMHIQACANSALASYWSSWHEGFRTSSLMKQYLEMGKDDECLGFFIVASAKQKAALHTRRRDGRYLNVTWRE